MNKNGKTLRKVLNSLAYFAYLNKIDKSWVVPIHDLRLQLISIILLLQQLSSRLVSKPFCVRERNVLVPK